MPEQLTLLIHPVLQPFCILITAVMLERFWVWPDKYHPLTVVKLIATRMAIKVNPKPGSSQYQQRLSGTLAFLVIWAPIAACLWLFIGLAEFPLFFEGLLLLVALQFSHITHTVKKISYCLQTEKKSLARNQLSPLVLRQTDTLSSLGIAKAVIEMTLLRNSYQYASVIFWFLLTGGIGALSYRLLFELHLCWNTKLKKFTHFGHPIAMVCAAMQWLPVRLNLFCIMLAENIGNAITAYRASKPKGHHSIILTIGGGAMGIRLGGPSIYEQQKKRQAKVGGNADPIAADLNRCLRVLNKSLAVWLVLSLLISALIFAIGNL